MLKVKVTPDNGDPYTIDVGSRDVLMWEKTGKGRTQASFATGISMADLYELAHLAGRRIDALDLSRADFERTCEVDLADDEDEDPTTPEA